MTYEDTRHALVELLATFGTEPRSMYDVGVPLVDRGFEQDDILNALYAFVSEGAIELLSGNRLRVLGLSVRKQL